MELNIQAKEVRHKTVKAISNVGHVYLPAHWVGKEVIVVLEDEKMKKIVEESWKVNKKELIELLETIEYEDNTQWNGLEDIDEDEFIVLKFSGGFYEIMDSTNRFLYFQGEEV